MDPFKYIPGIIWSSLEHFTESPITKLIKESLIILFLSISDILMKIKSAIELHVQWKKQPVQAAIIIIGRFSDTRFYRPRIPFQSEMKV